MGMRIVWQGSDCFTHMLAVGPTRLGETATILKPMIYNYFYKETWCSLRLVCCRAQR